MNNINRKKRMIVPTIVLNLVNKKIINDFDMIIQNHLTGYSKKE